MATKGSGASNRGHDASGTPAGKGGGGATGNANRGGNGGNQSGGGGALGGAGRQVYSSPVGPMPGTGDPMGNADQHFSEQGTGFGGFLDKVFGYDNVGQRVNAYRNNPAVRGSSLNPFIGMVPSFPYASPMYVGASILGAPMSPPGIVSSFPGIAAAIAQNKPYESMAQKIATELGATRGPQGPDVGVGVDRGGRGGALTGQQTPQGALTTEAPTNQPTTQPPPSQMPPYLNQYSMQGNQYNIPGLTPYGYQTPFYNYWGR